MLILLFLLGLVVLSLGAEIFVRGASRLATLFGLSPLIIGLTVVAFGTSAPEVAVVVQAGFEGQADMAFGNIIGSNISNFLFILGVSAMVAPLVVSRRLIQLEVPLLLGVSVAVLLLGYDGFLSTMEGFLLLGGAVVYTVFVVWSCKRENSQAQEGSSGGEGSDGKKAIPEENPGPQAEKPGRGWPKHAAMLLAGLAGLIFGASWLVEGASGIARQFGLSELVIGLTMVALGTSLPELATAVAASLRGERDLAIGNVVGSNLFNLMFVLGLSVIVIPRGLPVPPSSISFDIPVLLAVTAACLPIFLTRYEISRREGLLFISYYAAYTLYLLLFSVEHDLLPAYTTVMLRYIIPPTALLLLFVGFNAVRSREK